MMANKQCYENRASSIPVTTHNDSTQSSRFSQLNMSKAIKSNGFTELARYS